MITTRTTKAPIPWDGHTSLPNGKQEKQIGGLLSASAMAEWVTPQSMGSHQKVKKQAAKWSGTVALPL